MYQTLYRKYRPNCFEKIVGQDTIISILRNSIINNKISHAYLFIGPRGTGKTSTAKVFARAVNCSNNSNGDLCFECDSCTYSGDNNCLDIIEIDAASNNGVDEIRSLREKVNLVPSELKYKVYIIDEVHMLTISAFNALLKTLEEPPEHVIFILATTDPQKIPETIVSRCQSFVFNRISEDNIVDNLSYIAKNEKINIEKEVLKEIAIVSDGGMRDSIGLLDKLGSYTDKKIELEDFYSINGLITYKDIEEIVNLIFKGDIVNLISKYELWNNKGFNLVQIHIQILNYLKEKIVNSYISNENIDFDMYQKLASLINEKLYIMKGSSNPKIYIEILILDFINKYVKVGNNISREIIDEKNKSVEKENASKTDKKEVVDKINNEEIKSMDSKINIDNEINKNIVIKNDLSESNIKDIMNIRVNNAFVNATKDKLNEIKNLVNNLNEYSFDNEFGYLVCNFLDGNLRLASDDYLVLSYEYDSIVMDNLENLEDTQEMLSKLLNINIKLAIVSENDWNGLTKTYIQNKKNNISYKIIEEPKLMFEKNEKNEKNDDNIGNLDAFSGILEVS